MTESTVLTPTAKKPEENQPAEHQHNTLVAEPPVTEASKPAARRRAKPAKEDESGAEAILAVSHAPAAMAVATAPTARTKTVTLPPSQQTTPTKPVCAALSTKEPKPSCKLNCLKCRAGQRDRSAHCDFV